MREIKFRGKRIDNGEWVYGAFIPDATEPTHREMITWGFIKYYNREPGIMVTAEVGRNTVGQFAGLLDKNGKEIYEGDIVRCSRGCPHVVEFQLECNGMFLGGMPTFYLSNLNSGYAWTKTEEVIGNIHDNPELLEVNP